MGLSSNLFDANIRPELNKPKQKIDNHIGSKNTLKVTIVGTHSSPKRVKEINMYSRDHFSCLENCLRIIYVFLLLSDREHCCYERTNPQGA